jgi:hypothetical protein
MYPLHLLNYVSSATVVIYIYIYIYIYMCLYTTPGRHVDGMDVKLHVFLTSAVDESESSASHPGGFSPVKGTPICQLMKRLGGSQNRPQRGGKINTFFLLRIKFRSASHFKKQGVYKEICCLIFGNHVICSFNTRKQTWY